MSETRIVNEICDPYQQPASWNEEIGKYYGGIWPESQLAHFAVEVAGKSMPDHIPETLCVNGTTMAEAKTQLFDEMYQKFVAALSRCNYPGAVQEAFELSGSNMHLVPAAYHDELLAYRAELADCYMLEQNLHFRNLQ